MTEFLTGQFDPKLLELQRLHAQAELHGMMDGLWTMVGYDQDPIAASLEAFPQPERRRSDTEFSCPPELEAEFRARASMLGPGRPKAETLLHLNVNAVDVEEIEWGQGHKGLTEIWQALQSGQTAPLYAFASDRPIPLRKLEKGQPTDRIDLERLSTARLLSIGGQGLAEASGAPFFIRAGIFKERMRTDLVFRSKLEKQALAIPATEYEVAELILRSVVDGGSERVLDVGYDSDTGNVSRTATGQVREMGTIAGRQVVLVHRNLNVQGTRPNDTTTPTMLLMCDIAAALLGKSDITAGYYTSATYKPSRLAAGIKAGLIAARAGSYRRVVVPTYGYEDLSAIKGEDSAKPPTLGNIAGEIGKAAQEASDLRTFLAGI